MANRELTIREKRFIELLPENNWLIQRAGIAAGFSKSYAKSGLTERIRTNMALKQAYEAKRMEEQAENIANRQQRQAFWTLVMQDQVSGVRASLADRLRASELLGKSEADFTDRTIQQQDEEFRQLTEREEAEANRLANIRLAEGM